MQSYVISLETENKRRAHISNEFAKQNVKFNFFDALTPENAILFAKSLNINEQQNLAPGELACFMSHVSLWKKIQDENIPYMAIFEDDIFLGRNANQLLAEDDWIKSDWNLIKLEAFAPKIFLGKLLKKLVVSEREVYELKGKNLGTAGYILSTFGARTLLEYIQSVDDLPALDHLMFEDVIKNRIIKVNQVQPALCIQEMILFPVKSSQNFESKLVVERKKRMRMQKKKGMAKVKVELKRIIKQLMIMLFAKKSFFI